MQVKLINNEGQQLDLPFTLSWTDTNTTKEVPIIERATGDGASRAGKERVVSREFTISGPIYKYPRRDIRDKLDEIIEFMRFTPVRVYQQDYDERFIYAFPQGDSRSWTDNRKELDLDIPFIAPDPYFYSGTHIQNNIVVLNTDNDFERIISIETDGTVVSFPKIELEITEGSSSTLEIYNLSTGSFINFDRELTADDTVVIESDQPIVQINEENALNDINDEFLLHGFFLESEENNIEFTSETEIKFDSKITYRSRWL